MGTNSLSYNSNLSNNNSSNSNNNSLINSNNLNNKLSFNSNSNNNSNLINNVLINNNILNNKLFFIITMLLLIVILVFNINTSYASSNNSSCLTLKPTSYCQSLSIDTIDNNLDLRCVEYNTKENKNLKGNKNSSNSSNNNNNNSSNSNNNNNTTRNTTTSEGSGCVPFFSIEARDIGMSERPLLRILDCKNNEEDKYTSTCVNHCLNNPSDKDCKDICESNSSYPGCGNNTCDDEGSSSSEEDCLKKCPEIKEEDSSSNGNATWIESIGGTTNIVGKCSYDNVPSIDSITGNVLTPKRDCMYGGIWGSITNPCIAPYCKEIKEDEVSESTGYAIWPEASKDTTDIIGTCSKLGFGYKDNNESNKPIRDCDSTGSWTEVINPCEAITCPSYTDSTSKDVTIDGIARVGINDIPANTYYVKEANIGNHKVISNNILKAGYSTVDDNFIKMTCVLDTNTNTGKWKIEGEWYKDCSLPSLNNVTDWNVVNNEFKHNTSVTAKSYPSGVQSGTNIMQATCNNGVITYKGSLKFTTTNLSYTQTIPAGYSIGIDVYGGKGGDHQGLAGGYGGHVYGKRNAEQNNYTLNIYPGEAGKSASPNHTEGGTIGAGGKSGAGCNGGDGHQGGTNNLYFGSGGGACSMIKYNNNIILVAGGGGGSMNGRGADANSTSRGLGECGGSSGTNLGRKCDSPIEKSCDSIIVDNVKDLSGETAGRNYCAGGGGGGYYGGCAGSGRGGRDNCSPGGGGANYINTSYFSTSSNLSSNNAEDGYIIITFE